MQQLNCVSLLLLLLFMVTALSPLVATVHRELPMARNGYEGGHVQAKLDQAGSVSVNKSRPATAVSNEDRKEEAAMRKCKKGRKSCSFRTRKLPADGKNHFDGHMPFTADYHSVRRHPPSHN